MALLAGIRNTPKINRTLGITCLKDGLDTMGLILITLLRVSAVTVITLHIFMMVDGLSPILIIVKEFLILHKKLGILVAVNTGVLFLGRKITVSAKQRPCTK